MLWEKRDPKNPNKIGYLYIRESIYVRDKRSLTKKPNKLGSGKAYKNRYKYTKKRDIYCGKIILIHPKYFITYKNYIEKQNLDYLQFKLKSKFDELLNSFIDYLLYINEIDKDNFYNGKKIAYALANGYLSKETIKFIKRFQARGNFEDIKEIQRFANRCENAGIYDEDIIMNLYLKIIPTPNVNNIKDELIELNNKKLIVKKFDNFRDFIRKEYK